MMMAVEDHVVFHDDDGGTGHDDFDDGDDPVTSDDSEIQSFGSRVKDTFNYLIPQAFIVFSCKQWSIKVRL